MEHIVIVGGGSAGWLAAAGLIRYFPNKKITLVESKNIPIIGVGESTAAPFKHFINHHLMINDVEFMSEVDAIYKMSVRFKDFYHLGDTGFHYPFQLPNTKAVEEFGAGAWDLVKHYNKSLPPDDYIKSMISSYWLFSENKINENFNGEFDNYHFNLEMGYHLDATKLGTALKDHYCLPRGVNHVIADVADAQLNEQGVEYLELANGEKLYGDLFVDCTGYRSMLLGGKMKAEFVDVTDKLPNNRAWATPIKYKDVYKEMQPYTSCTALKNGWAWYTPISSRIGNGYAYSDKHTTPEAALQEFKEYLASDNVPVKLSKEEIDNLPFFEIKMKPGYYKQAMVKNVVAVGLSGGFLEPLEGTGLLFISSTILQLVKILQRKGINQFVIEAFNKYMEDRYETWLETLSVFYAQSIRDDSEYWREIKNKQWNFDRNLWKRMMLDHGGHAEDAYSYISRGCEFTMDVDDTSLDRWKYWDPNVDFEQLAIKYSIEFEKRKRRWQQAADQSPHIYDYMKQKGIIK